MNETEQAEMRKIVCYGDSNTFGHDAQNAIGMHYPDSIRWTGRLSAYGWEAVNCGLNGRQIPVGDAETEVAAAQIRSHLPADVVAVMLGSNDILWNPTFTAEDSAARMETFLRALLPLLRDTKLLLISPPPMIPGAWVEEARLTEESVRLGPMYAEIAQRLGIAFTDAALWAPELSFDGLHLSEEGHRCFAERLAEVLQTL